MKCPAAKPKQVLIVNTKAFRTSTQHSVDCCVVDSQTGSLDVGTVPSTDNTFSWQINSHFLYRSSSENFLFQR
jgi:hypothetical protein